MKNKEYNESNQAEREKQGLLIHKNLELYAQLDFSLLTNQENEILYKGLFAVQRGCCAICGLCRADSKKSFVFDVNSKTNQVRGILCRGCKRGLKPNKGLELSREAVEYLENPAILLLFHKKYWGMSNDTAKVLFLR